MVGFGTRLRELRQSNNLTQAQLAQRLDITTSVISAYETEIRMPSYEVLISLSRIFKVSTDYLLGLDTPSSEFDVTGLNEEEKELVKKIISIIKRTK